MDERIIFQFIQKILRKGNSLEIKPHAFIRMIERGIDVDDIYDILLNPKYIKKEVKSSRYYGKYNYRVMGKNEWSVVVSIYTSPKESLVVVTVID